MQLTHPGLVRIARVGMVALLAALAACGGGGGAAPVEPPPVATTPTVVLVPVPATSIEVATTSTVVLDFSEEMDAGTLTAANVTLSANAASVPVTLSYSARRLTVSPVAELALNTRYTVTVGTGAKSQKGKPLAAPFSTAFTTVRIRLMVEAHDLPVVAGPAAIAIGDVNGDGLPDVVMIRKYGPINVQGILVYLRTADGKLAPPVEYGFNQPGCSATTIAVGDVNGDGKADVVTGSFVGQSDGNRPCGLVLFLQDSSGGLARGVDVQTVDVYKIRIADANGDGRQDVIGVGYGEGVGLTIWLQQADGSLGAGVSHELGIGALGGLDVGDFNGDGRTDFVVMGGFNVSQIAVVLQRADGTLAAPVSYPLARQPNGLGVGDLNGDGRTDVVVSFGGNYPTGAVQVLLQTAAGTMAAQSAQVVYDIPGPVAIADMDGDGRNDIVVLHDGWATAGIIFQLPDGTHPIEYLYDIPYSAYDMQGLSVADLDGDGRPEVAISDLRGLVILRQPH